MGCRAYTIRVFLPGRDTFDVLVRVEPEAREHGALRFTVFPASDEPDPRQIDRLYFYGDRERKKMPPILGEGALLDYLNRW